MGDIHKALSKLSSIWEKNKEIIAEDYDLIQERIDEYKNFVADFMTTDFVKRIKKNALRMQDGWRLVKRMFLLN